MGLPVNGTERQICPGLPETGPRTLTGGPRPLPLLLQPKTGRPPGGATAAWALIGCPARGHRSLPCPACELPLVNGSWQGRALPPPFPQPIPLPSACSSASQKGGTDSNCLLQKRAFDKCPHPLSGGKASRPSKLLGSASLSPHPRLPPGLQEQASRPHCNLIPTQVPGRSHPAFQGRHANSSAKARQIDWDTVSVLEQLGPLTDVTPRDLSEAAPQQEAGVG